jgi:hypothetical protein
MFFVKAFLHRMKNTAVCQTFNRHDLRAVALHGQMGATLHRLAIDINRAGPAMTCFAANVCACKTEFLAQEVNQQGTWLNRLLLQPAINLHTDYFLCHE